MRLKIIIIWTPIKKLKIMRKEKLATLFLAIGLFLNPFGFDAIQIALIKLTCSYSKANFIMYCLAGFFFGLYFYCSGNNPWRTIKEIYINGINKLKS